MTYVLTDDERQVLNRRLLAYLRKTAIRGPNHQRVGPFLAIFSPDNDNPYLNYAIPDDDAAPGDADIAALVQAFEARRRKPRLEYVPAAAPKVEPMLIANGFIAESRVPIMLCRPGMEGAVSLVPGFDVFVASADADLEGAEQAQAEAYGGASRGPAGLHRTIRHGGVVVAARDTSTGAIVGAGVVMPPVDGISEVTSIGVRVASRRRGVAGAITTLLAREGFAAGVTLAWLTPAGKDEERIYVRAGFASVSEALHISR